jgi:NitT/TauT family transport system permease protein
MTVTIMPEGEYAEFALADRTRRRSRKRQVMLIRLLLLTGIIALWQAAAGRIIDESWLSSPSEIADRLWGWMRDGTLPYNSWITLQEMGIGFLIGASTGIIAGLALGLSETVGDTLHPFVLAVYSLPKVAMGPLFILWFGIDMQMKIALSAITVFFLVFWNAYAGVRQSDQELIDTVRMMGASRLQLITKIIVPGTLAWIYTGLKLSVPYALIGAIVGEIIASNRGLGYLISYSAGNFDTAGVIGALLVLMAISVTLNAIIGQSERRAFRWQTRRGS